jgi:hypothetical protein
LKEKYGEIIWIQYIVNRSNIASHCSLVLCLLSDNNTMSACRISITTKSTYQVHFRKRYIKSIHIATVERRAQHMAKNIPFHVSADQISSECNSETNQKSQKIKDVMSDGRMWMNSRSWCTLNLNKTPAQAFTLAWK